MTAKDRYRALCEVEPTIPLFSRAWWLDALAGEDHWDVAVVESGGQIVASMPYVIRHRWGRLSLSHPPLTQTLGPWLRETGAKQAPRLARQKELMQKLIQALGKYDHFGANWHHSQTNWLPFYWAGFSQTTRYTYRLPDICDEEKLWSGFRENIRGDIRKAEGRFGLQVRTGLRLDTFLRLNVQTFERQGKDLPYSRDLVEKLDEACQRRNARQVFIAEDEQGRAHAGVYIVWDANSAYYLMGGGDPELRKSGATSLCMWEAIKFASTVTKSFDFEGSMIEPVERFFRAFGAEQTPYFAVSHTPSKLIRAAQCLRRILR
ncbi:putative methicillin resistance protein [Thioflavicoccus mobilis 8321]|uniref:Putative methicillin resistance protein n=1 Tax=Thioflavicoccus mobilis 8321 TaxID=765912 RepID=L0GUC0_9GAMM|nr:GNAT family N-acetyltransferase [Thioflavicoccus mobilis]AGA88904.1 putative methicillin resistance protein [Thioflavicoccus mobilis 8321]